MTHRRTPASFSRIYFPFGDGVFSHDCVACEAACCRGSGFGLPTAELDSMARDHPTLVYFARPTASPGFLTFSGFGPRCFFLSDNRCSIHEARGQGAKPYVCKLFPANQFLLAGDVLIVDLHPACPVRLNDPNGDGAGHPLSHQEIAASIEPYREVVGGRARRVLGGTGDDELQALLRREARRRDLTTRHRGDLTRFLERDAAAGGERAPRLEAFYASLVDFLRAGEHLDRRRDHAARDELLVALAPRVSLEVILQLEGRRRRLGRAFPRLMLVIQVYLQLVANTNESEVTPATVRELVASSLPLFWLLAHLDRAPILTEVPDGETTFRIPASQEAPVRQLVSFIHRHNPSRGMALGEILDSVGPATLLDRLLLLRSVPVDLLGRIDFQEPR